MKRIYPKNEELPQYVGKRLSLEMGAETMTGVVIGWGEGLTSDGKEALRTWLLQGQTEDIEFSPEGQRVYLAD